MRLRARDRDRLRTSDEPSELGEPVDRASWRSTSSVASSLRPPPERKFELQLARRVRDLPQVSGERLAALADVTLPAIPDGLERTALIVADASR